MREAAAMLSIGRSTLYDLIDRGDLVPIRIGRCVRFRPEDLRAFIDRLSDGEAR